MEFKHPALELREKRKIVYSAFSRENISYKNQISKFVFENNSVPINPFLLTEDLFYNKLVDSNLLRHGNNNLLWLADEIWVFGKISDGMLAEIILGKEKNKPIRFFSIDKKGIQPLDKETLMFFDDAKDFKHLI